MKKIFAFLVLLLAINAAQANSTKTKVIFIVGGLAGSGKTTHIIPLMQSLSAKQGFSVAYLDKAAIARSMPAGTTSSQVYYQMISHAEQNLRTHDVIIMEGNIIGNLGCFSDFIRAQHKRGAAIIALYFQCKDPIEQFNRLKARAKKDPFAAKRDAKRLQSFEFYRDIDLPGEIKHQDDQLAKNKDLIDQGMLKVLVLETAGTAVATDVSKKIIATNLESILDFMRSENALS